MGQIILASGSPRRRELLEQIGISFEICPAKGEELMNSTLPWEVVSELSAQKAGEVAGMLNQYGESHKELVTPQDIMVIGADTVVAAENEILGKPKDKADAKRMLKKLAGNSHDVYTGVTLVFLSSSGRAGKHTFYEKTSVTMREMSDTEIDRYIATGEPMDKAGAYGIQGAFGVYICGIEGDYNTIVGLPLARVYQEMKKYIY